MSGAHQKPFISFKNIEKSFGDAKVIKNLSLDVYENETLGLIGRSGSGKSTLLKILIGVYDITSGTIIYKGQDITKDKSAIRKIVGLTTQENSFYDKLTILENMNYYAGLYSIKKSEAKKRIASILHDVGLFDKKNLLSGDISGGMKRRLDFAISLIHDPELLILDEPTTGLDPILVEQFWNVVNAVKKKGKTIIVISHIFDELVLNCSRVAMLDSGTIKKTVEIGKDTDLAKIFRSELK